MKQRRIVEDRDFLPVADWIQRLGEESRAFEVTSAIDVESKQSGRRQSGWDYFVTLTTNPDGRKIDLFVEVRKQLSPNALLGLVPRLKWLPPDGVMLICAPYISSRVAELCTEHHVSYLDSVGNCRVVAPGLFIHVSGRPNRPLVKTAIDPFSKKSSRVVRTLLTHVDKGWQVQKLAEHSDVSLGLASRVKRSLVEEGYLEERNRLLFVRDPASLLQRWASSYRPSVKRVSVFSLAKPSETEVRIAEWCSGKGISYALTQLSAAWRYSPMVRYDKSVVYVGKQLDSSAQLKELLRHLDARQVDTGSNCVLWITDDPAVFVEARQINGITVVSPLQLYLDLKRLAGRGEDAAQEILDNQLHDLVRHSSGDRERQAGGQAGESD